jgi:hypothetical protein
MAGKIRVKKEMNSTKALSLVGWEYKLGVRGNKLIIELEYGTGWGLHDIKSSETYQELMRENSNRGRKRKEGGMYGG